MTDLFLKVPIILEELDPDNVINKTCALKGVNDVHFENVGFGNNPVNVLVKVFEPSDAKKAEILALPDVTLLTESAFNAAKPNYPR